MSTVVTLPAFAPQDRLAILASEIRAAHQAVEAAESTAIAKACEAGEKLIEAKSICAPRSWLRWLGEIGLHERQAQRYIQAAQLKRQKPTRVSEIIQNRAPLRELVRLTSDPVAPRPAPTPIIPHRTLGTGDNEWFTPAEYVEAARKVLGKIDLDPASHPIAQEWIRATRFFTREDDGLEHPWRGRVWLNPPYGREDITPFIDKLLGELSAGRVTAAILLTHNYTDTSWFHKAASVAVGSCFTLGRIKFTDAAGYACNPTQGQTFFYYGKAWDTFASVFSEFGSLCKWGDVGSSLCRWGCGDLVTARKVN